jgi:hypothetical protein
MIEMYKSPVLFILVTIFLIDSSVLLCQGDLSEVYGEVNKAIVIIKVADENREVGSGVIVGITGEGNALILTARHVVAKNKEEIYDTVTVTFSGIPDNYTGIVSDEKIPPIYDMAFVMVSNPPKDVEIINFREETAFKGENVGTIGHPQGETYTWSQGVISNIYGDYIRHTAELNIGSSGGPLLDDCGRMLGMNVQIVTPQKVEEEGSKGIGVLQDTLLETGTSITLSSGTILSVMSGLFSETSFEEKWEYKKYCSFWEKLYKNPFYWIGEAAVIGTVIYLIIPKSEPPPEPTFGSPPNPP